MTTPDVLPALCDCGHTRTVSRGWNRLSFDAQAPLRCQECRATTSHAVVGLPDWREHANRVSTTEARQALEEDIATLEAVGVDVRWDGNAERWEDPDFSEWGELTRWMDDGAYLLELNPARPIPNLRKVLDWAFRVVVLGEAVTWAVTPSRDPSQACVSAVWGSDVR